MHVHAQPVAGTVHVEAPVCLGLDEFGGVAREQPQIHQALGQDTHRRFVVVDHGSFRTHRRDGGRLGRQHQLVDGALLPAEAAIDRKRAGDVRGVAVVLRTGIDQQQVPVPEFAAVLGVVEDAGVGAAGDDGGIGRPLAAAQPEFAFQFRLHLVFEAARRGALHGPDMGPGGNAGRPAHQLELIPALDQPHLVEKMTQVHDFPRGMHAGALPAPDLAQAMDDFSVEFRIAAHHREHPVLVFHQGGQGGFQFIDGEGLVGAEVVHRALDALASAIPEFPFRILFAAEQDELAFRPSR